MLNIEKNRPRLQQLHLPLLQQKNVAADVLRLDEIDPIISGNKWYKLKEYLKDAKDKNIENIVTFGGAYSNHIVATAAACKAYRCRSFGVIRGEKPEHFSHTLSDAQNLGMKLFFISREDYKQKAIPEELLEMLHPEVFYKINEGGYGALGVKGAATILNDVKNDYTHILAAVGTGTMLAGLTSSSKEHQNVIGISVMKNNFALEDDVRSMTSKKNFSIFHHYHFGGYAKKDDTLLNFMNLFFEETSIPTDFVYTAKLFYAVNDLLAKNHFPEESKILIIHSGGLQGNRSLPKNSLIFL